MKTNNFGRIIVTAILISTACFGLAGCNKSPADKSPQELKDAFKPHDPPADLQKRMAESRKAMLSIKTKPNATAPAQ